MTDSFEVKLYKKDIQQAIKSAATLTEELTLTFDVEGVTTRLMDASHVALLDVSMPNSMFEKYNVESEFNVGVRADELEKMIDMFDDKSSNTVTRTEENLLILSNRNEKYTLRLIEATKTDQPIPRTNFDAKIVFDQEITTKDFIKQLQKINKISDYITFETVNNNKFTMSGKGDIGNAEASYERGQISINNNCDTTTTYSLEYILPFLKTVKDQPVTLEYSERKPLKIEAKIQNVGRLHFYLAPRVED